MEHGLKYIAVYVKKNINLHSCHNFSAGSRQAARGARICKTRLLWYYVMTKFGKLNQGEIWKL